MQKNGFTLIEILVVIAIIGMLAVIMVPTFRGRSPKYQREEAIAKLNSLSSLAWQNALITNIIHTINFNLKENKVSVKMATGKYDEKGLPVTKPMEREYVNSEFTWPENLEIKQFFIEGIDEIKVQGRTNISLFFLIMPDGLAQNVIINFVDTKDSLSDGQPKQFGLVLNPFNAQFRVYDTFQK